MDAQKERRDQKGQTVGNERKNQGINDVPYFYGRRKDRKNQLIT